MIEFCSNENRCSSFMTLSTKKMLPPLPKKNVSTSKKKEKKSRVYFFRTRTNDIHPSTHKSTQPIILVLQRPFRSKIFPTATRNKQTQKHSLPFFIYFSDKMETENQERLKVAYFPQAVASSNVVGLCQRREIENRRPKVVDRASLAHHHLYIYIRHKWTKNQQKQR